MIVLVYLSTLLYLNYRITGEKAYNQEVIKITSLPLCLCLQKDLLIHIKVVNRSGSIDEKCKVSHILKSSNRTVKHQLTTNFCENKNDLLDTHDYMFLIILCRIMQKH